MKAKDVKIIFPLDVADRDEAIRILREVGPHIDIVKVGKELERNLGAPEALKVAKTEAPKGVKIFADFKDMDIPNTVAAAVRGTTKCNVDFLNVMALGGCKMIAAAVKAVRDEYKASSTYDIIKIPKIIAVTILTSLSADDLILMGFTPPYGYIGEFKEDQQRFVTSVVLKLAAVAIKGGADIILCSPWEAAAIREQWPGIEIFTPSIRPSWAPLDDQVRTMTVYEAVQAGSTGLVIGRPIRIPPPGRTREDVIREIREDIKKALAEK